MKRKSIYLTCVTLTVAGFLTGCADSYLDVTPVTDINSSQLSDPSIAKTAVGGIFESMNHPWDAIDLNQNVGEPYISYVMNECMGIDLYSGLWNNPGMPGLAVWPRMNGRSEWPTNFTWAYYYGIIGECNRVIDAITATSEGGEVSDSSLYFYKASALTVRAHAYTRLIGYYGQRWEDSKEGEVYCIPLRITASNENLPLSTMNDVLNQIYNDCDEAVKLFEMSGMKRSEKYEVDANVANGIWARAALIKHDWQTAADKAEAALNGYTVMSGDELFAGFMKDNKDLIWGSTNAGKLVGYWSWGCHYASNGHYVAYWGYGAGAISIDLYNQLDVNDQRRKYFWMPDKLEALPKRANPGGLKGADFWNPKLVAESAFLNMNVSNIYVKNNKDGLSYGMIDCIVNWLADYKNNIFKGSAADIKPSDDFYNYFYESKAKKSSTKSVQILNSEGVAVYGTPVNIPFGAQCKFWSYTPYGNTVFPYMRASEMALTRAEALAELGNAQAAKVFEDFQKLRVNGYKCTTSGDALINEIRVSRRAELWGEGHNFTDIKRWNMRHEHREWVANDPTSGNFTPGEGLTEAQKSQTYSNGWRLAIPTREINYNPLIDVSLLPTFGSDK